MEIWQVLGSLTGLSLSVLLGMLSARLLIIFLRRPVEQEFSTPKWFRPSLVFCLTLFFASPVPIIFGVPPQIRHVTVPIIGIALVLLMTMIIWQLLKIYSLHFSRIAERSLGAGDDIAVSLLFALLRLSTIAACGLGLAHFLSISTVNILAGLGIGGLAVAFAARETLANIFGAAVLAVDRPFKRGDMISMGDVRGTVEHVGIRSTRLRTIKNSEIVVPNAKLADTSITNHGASDPLAPHAIFRLSMESDTVSLSDFVDELKANFSRLSGISDADNNILIHRIDGKDVEIKILLSAPSDSNESRKLLEDLALSALAKGREAGIGLAWTPA
jgi:small-conductance mechanosensitive channel